MFPASDFLHPKYWLTWFGFGLLRLVSLLPLPIIWFLAQALGNLMYVLLRSRRHITLVNLRLSFPEKQDKEHRSIARHCFQLIAFTAISIGVNWWASPARLKRLVTIEGREHYDHALEQGHNVIFLAPHAAALEMAGLVLSLERPMITMYKHTRKPLLNDYVKHKRGRFGGLLVERREPLRNLLKLIRKGHPFYYLPDQDAGAAGIFAPFFGHAASTYPMLSKFSRMGKAVVIPCFTYIKPGGKGWHVVIHPPLDGFPEDDDMKDTSRMNETIENMIKVDPAQYFWVHKRFKTRPEGEADLYR